MNALAELCRNKSITLLVGSTLLHRWAAQALVKAVSLAQQTLLDESASVKSESAAADSKQDSNSASSHNNSSGSNGVAAMSVDYDGEGDADEQEAQTSQYESILSEMLDSLSVGVLALSANLACR